MSNARKRAYVVLGDTDLETFYGMKLTSYSIGTPEILTKYIDVPGRAGMLDATLALNGKVNYKKRSVSATFHIENITHEEYEIIIQDLYSKYHGIESEMYFSFEYGYYYKGRFEISGSKDNDISANITISGDYIFPYKLQKNIEEATATTSTSVICYGYKYNGEINFIASNANMSVTYDGTTYALAKGDNLIPEIRLLDGENTLTIKGKGTVRIEYERGVL